jgi:hypothetical protein
MIQLASDPNASRQDWRAAPPAAKEGEAPATRGRSGHAWPFISRQAGKPDTVAPPVKPASEHGS